MKYERQQSVMLVRVQKKDVWANVSAQRAFDIFRQPTSSLKARVVCCAQHPLRFGKANNRYIGEK